MFLAIAIAITAARKSKWSGVFGAYRLLVEVSTGHCTEDIPEHTIVMNGIHGFKHFELCSEIEVSQDRY